MKILYPLIVIFVVCGINCSAHTVSEPNAGHCYVNIDSDSLTACSESSDSSCISTLSWHMYSYAVGCTFGHPCREFVENEYNELADYIVENKISTVYILCNTDSLSHLNVKDPQYYKEYLTKRFAEIAAEHLVLRVDDRIPNFKVLPVAMGSTNLEFQNPSSAENELNYRRIDIYFPELDDSFMRNANVKNHVTKALKKYKFVTLESIRDKQKKYGSKKSPAVSILSADVPPMSTGLTHQKIALLKNQH